ncbi:Peptide methionine sulfoxide reductase MsrA [Thioalkalivibrio nitratireducens DSM 14787]|uniref:Peptide methionine sulfoxide reductase MsrA n=1 Tax=Thioalkalivibrio nitratireducens (strain DSM 14787 / UNIQEM 213 / ALEN2) TaxID=1255043 RepID=L0DSZ8_THIND|nr:peptide-methionine (S)-S-oxide reductase MsrA [Thioalkalivibrio nitratireducens]AGA32133.1 Peptide methionine sulfoxide reductase MsrA [Thioalkalivibrio nitratireducens DSM 14787]
MFFGATHKIRMPDPSEALSGRAEPMPVSGRHAVLGTLLAPPYPEGMATIHFGMGCFWGAERLFWRQPGVFTTAVGYGGGYTPNPTYREVCSGLTGHNELVRVVYDPGQIGLEALLKVFWEGHDPTQGMRQGNDVGTQYRSGIYLSDPTQRAPAEASRQRFEAALRRVGQGPITTEIVDLGDFYFAEDYHQQYLEKNPGGYCGLGGLGIGYPAGA